MSRGMEVRVPSWAAPVLVRSFAVVVALVLVLAGNWVLESRRAVLKGRR